jgi:hypothetical protein
LRVSGSSNPWSAHQAGMSALWHDANYVPEERFEIPTVQKQLDDFALPSEQHQLPDGVQDPFEKLEAVFEVAAEQMERGLKGSSFLHGKPAPSVEHTPSKGVERVQQTMQQEVHDQDHPTAIDNRRETMRLRQLDQAANSTVSTKVQGSTKTAAEKEAEHVGQVGDALGVAATFVPTAAANAVQTAVQGPLPAMAAQATAVAGAVVSAGQVAAVGVAEGLKEDEPVTVRRGLRRSGEGDPLKK